MHKISIRYRVFWLAFLAFPYSLFCFLGLVSSSSPRLVDFEIDLDLSFLIWNRRYVHVVSVGQKRK